MSSYQRVALYIIFDSIEKDLTDRIRSMVFLEGEEILTSEEAERAFSRISRREGMEGGIRDQSELIPGLDLGEKYSVLMRHKRRMDQAAQNYFEGLVQRFGQAIATRNAVMHGRPLTTTEFSMGFVLASDLIKSPRYWPNLSTTYVKYNENPASYIEKSIEFLDDEPTGEALNNLPLPDYDDTGFLPRADLERDLRKKILGRHPVVTVLGEGGNGKTALTLQTLYGLLASNDHDFDAIIWMSAKTTRLGIQEIERIEEAITSSIGLMDSIANQFEPGDESALSRVRKLMAESKILLAIDNLETILDDLLVDFASDVPGESKLVLTSRVPLGVDICVHVGEFDEKEARNYLRRLIEAYDIISLKKKTSDWLDGYAKRLNRKPLLLKWFALGVAAGIDPNTIVSRPENALKFCMENVIDRLDDEAKKISRTLSVLPGAVSAALLQEVTELSGVQIEAGISQLLRFALVQRDDNGGERLLRLSNFVKAYITRILPANIEFTQLVLRRYRAIESSFQIERGQIALNRYDTRYFTVRNRSETLVSRKLKQVARYVNQGRILEAEELLTAQKAVAPDYFEVYRVEAFLATRESDIQRASAAYVSAIELSNGEPQIYLAYAIFLTKHIMDYAGAYKYYNRALEIDPKSLTIYVSAILNAFFNYDFVFANDLLKKAKATSELKFKDNIVISDLTTQLFHRQADYLFRAGDFDGAEVALRSLLMHLSGAERYCFDEKHVEHLNKVLRLIGELRRGYFPASDILNDLEQFILLLSSGSDAKLAIGESDLRLGNLREEGRNPTFGFLRDQFGEDTYLGRNSVSEQVWASACEGHLIKFRISYLNGRKFATDVIVEYRGS